MRFTIVAVAAGLAIGFIRGGSLRHLGQRSFQLWPVLAVGLALQVVSGWIEGSPSLFLLLLSYALLIVFAVANLALVGMWLVVLGIALNLATIAVNGGMPVRQSAVLSAGVATEDNIDELEFDGKHHLEEPDDRLMAISDIIPVAPLREVLSIGDLVMSVGVATVLSHLLVPRRRRFMI